MKGKILVGLVGEVPVIRKTGTSDRGEGLGGKEGYRKVEQWGLQGPWLAQSSKRPVALFLSIFSCLFASVVYLVYLEI